MASAVRSYGQDCTGLLVEASEANRLLQCSWSHHKTPARKLPHKHRGHAAQRARPEHGLRGTLERPGTI